MKPYGLYELIQDYTIQDFSFKTTINPDGSKQLTISLLATKAAPVPVEAPAAPKA